MNIVGYNDDNDPRLDELPIEIIDGLNADVETPSPAGSPATPAGSPATPAGSPATPADPTWDEQRLIQLELLALDLQRMFDEVLIDLVELEVRAASLGRRVKRICQELIQH